MSAPLNNHNRRTHGCSGTRLYRIWKTMRQRCNNPNNKKYKNYGNRGIAICEEWNDFSKFHKWAISNGYSDNLSIDRIDVYGNYEPSNCRWISPQMQANNKTNNRIIYFNNEALTMADFCRKYNLNYKKFSQRLSRGATVEEAMSL